MPPQPRPATQSQSRPTMATQRSKYNEASEQAATNSPRRPANSAPPSGSAPLQGARQIIATDGNDFNSPVASDMGLMADSMTSETSGLANNMGRTTAANPSSSEFMGVLEVTARTGDGALPIDGALIIVTSVDENGRRLEYTAMTDENGTARLFDLPASNPANSEQPDMPDRYYLYDVNISKPGYFEITSRDVPLFGGITSRQDFRMIPLPEGVQQQDIEISNTEPQDLV